MNKYKLAILLSSISLLFSSCKSKKDLLFKEEVFKNKVIIFLAKESEPGSKLIHIQNFLENGKPSIPVFTSKKKMIASTEGADLPYPIRSIDGLYLLSFMDGDETIRVNPNLSDEAFYKVSELKEYFKTDIKKFMETEPTK